MSEEHHEEEDQDKLEERNKESPESTQQQSLADKKQPSKVSRFLPVILIVVIVGIIMVLLAFFSRYNLRGRINEEPPVTYFAEDQIIVTGNITDVVLVTQNVAARLGIQLIRVDNVDEEKIPDFISNSAPSTPATPVVPTSTITPTTSPPITPTNTPPAATIVIPTVLVPTEPIIVVQTESVDGENVAQPLALQAANNANTNFFLYRVIFTNPTTIENVMQAINEESSTMGKTVASGLNYAIGSPPLEVEGDPNCGEGTAITESLNITTTADAKSIFFNQWALNISNGIFSSENTAAQAANIKSESSIGLFNSESKNGITPTRTIDANILGANVIVAVFDTSPFDLRGERVLDTDTADPIDDFGSDIVNHFETIGDPDVRDHGVFGASLVDVIAPESDIRFYRVLDQSNRGDLYTLLRALETLSETWELENRRPLVINMSLGIHPPPGSQAATDLVLLQTILQSFYDRGAVIVAAAGNDSAEKSRMGMEPAPMQYPAAYDFVIGVGASNARNEMACFSNHANILAPGGDNDANCMPAVNACATGEIGSAACVVGYVYTPPDAHYAYWNGTSFAAPMVSGVAALLMGDGLNRTKEEVYAILTPNIDKETIPGTPTTIPPVLDLADAVKQAAALPTPMPQP